MSNKVTTNAKPHVKHHHSKPQGKHHGDGSEADHHDDQHGDQHDDDYVSQLHGVVREAGQHSGKLQEVIRLPDAPDYRSGWSGRASDYRHPYSQNM